MASSSISEVSSKVSSAVSERSPAMSDLASVVKPDSSVEVAAACTGELMLSSWALAL